MGQYYHHFSAYERNVLQHQLNLGRSQAQIALALGRSRSTVSREIARNAAAASSGRVQVKIWNFRAARITGHPVYSSNRLSNTKPR